MTAPHTGSRALTGRRLLFALLTAVLTAAAGGTLTATLAHSLAPDWASDPNQLATLVIAIVYAAVLATLMLMLGPTPSTRRSRLGLRPPTPRATVFGLAVWAAAYLFAAAVYLALTPFGLSLAQAIDLLAAVGADNGRLHDASAGVTAIILFRILVVSPLTEELLFRGALFTWLRSRLDARWTILITGVGFGLIHQSPVFLPLAITVGIVAGWIRERTGSTWVCVIAHAVQSMIVVFGSLLATGWDTSPLLGQ